MRLDVIEGGGSSLTKDGSPSLANVPVTTRLLEDTCTSINQPTNITFIVLGAAG